MKKRIKSTLVFLMMLLFCIAAAEVYLRVTHFCPPSIFLPHPVVGSVMAPNRSYRVVKENNVVARSNSMGFADRDHEITAPEGVRRMVFVGDSFVKAVQVQMDERFTDLASKRLAEAGDCGVWESINLGIAGANTGVKWLTYGEFGRRFTPDLVFVDLTILEMPKNIRAGDVPVFSLDDSGSLVTNDGFSKTRAYRLRQTVAPIKARSALVTLFMKGVQRIRTGYLPGILLGKLAPEQKKKSTPADPVVKERQRRKKLDVFQAIMKAFKQDVDRDGATLVALFFARPVAITTSPDSDDPELVAFQGERDDMFHQLETLDIPVIDTLPVFRKHFEETGEDVSYWPKTNTYGHVNETGHELTAGLIADWVSDFSRAGGSTSTRQKPGVPQL